MRYFIANLAAHLLVTAVFVVLTSIFAARNKKRKVKHVAIYFLPIVCAIAAIVYIVLFTAPRLTDVNNMLNSNYYYNSGTVEKIGTFRNYFVIDGNYYYMNPLRNKMNEGDVVRIKRTPNSSFTVDITMIEDTDMAEDTEPEETN